MVIRKDEGSWVMNFEIRRDGHGFPAAIAQGGVDLIHLHPSWRTECFVYLLVDKLNGEDVDEKIRVAVEDVMRR